MDFGSPRLHPSAWRHFLLLPQAAQCGHAGALSRDEFLHPGPWSISPLVHPLTIFLAQPAGIKKGIPKLRADREWPSMASVGHSWVWLRLRNFGAPISAHFKSWQRDGTAELQIPVHIIWVCLKIRTVPIGTPESTGWTPTFHPPQYYNIAISCHFPHFWTHLESIAVHPLMSCQGPVRGGIWWSSAPRAFLRRIPFSAPWHSTDDRGDPLAPETPGLVMASDGCKHAETFFSGSYPWNSVNTYEYTHGHGWRNDGTLVLSQCIQWPIAMSNPIQPRAKLWSLVDL